MRDLRLSLIDACNFRCPYCMPADRIADDHGLDAASRLSFDEIETLVRGFARLGVRKLRLTGGEPLLRKRLPELVARLAAIDGIDDLALTTNGSLLSRQARPLRDAGLRRLTVSLDTLDAEVFRALSGGRGELGDVLAGIDAAQAAGFAPVKLNCVVQRGVNDAGIERLAGFAREHGHVLRFIEYMDVGTCNGWSRERVVPSAELRDRIAAHWPLRRWIRTIAAKWPSATPTKTGAAKSASSVRSARRSAATATAPACPPMGGSTPACSPPAGTTCGRRLRRANRRWQRMWPPRGRAAAIATARFAAKRARRASMSRCTWSAAEPAR